jgi:glycosyltransferase involved in cell wall biosynthesis
MVPLTHSNAVVEARHAPRFTIVTVVRNAERSLAACLDSVARQRYPGVEHVVVDGASTDRTLEILRERDRVGLRWTSESDAGIYDAMNKGVRLATGDFVLFLGADDVLLVDLERVAPLLVDLGTIYYGDTYWPASHRLYDGPFSALKLALRNICQQAIFYPRGVFEKYAFDLRYRIQADWELNMRCFSDPAFRFEYIPVLVAAFNDEDGSSTRHRDLAMEADYPVLLTRHFPARVALPLRAAVVVVRASRKLLASRGASASMSNSSTNAAPSRMDPK